MTEHEIRNKLNEIREYVCSKYFTTDQAKALYAEKEKLEKMLEVLSNDKEKARDKRKED
jgi:hypothetical protein